MYEGLISIVPHVPLLRLGEREGESMRKTEKERSAGSAPYQRKKEKMRGGEGEEKGDERC